MFIIIPLLSVKACALRRDNYSSSLTAGRSLDSRFYARTGWRIVAHRRTFVATMVAAGRLDYDLDTPRNTNNAAVYMWPLTAIAQYYSANTTVDVLWRARSVLPRLPCGGWMANV